MIRLIVIVSLVLLACNDKSIQSRIEAADRIEVIDNETGFSHVDTTAVVVNGFKEVLNTAPEPTDCTPQGRVVFKKGDKILSEVGYYKDASACTFLITESKGKKTGYHLSANALVYLGVYFQKLKMKHNAGNH
jgi:hypothetical protein